MKKFLNFITFLIVASLPCYADNPTYSTSDNYSWLTEGFRFSYQLKDSSGNFTTIIDNKTIYFNKEGRNANDLEEAFSSALPSSGTYTGSRFIFKAWIVKAWAVINGTTWYTNNTTDSSFEYQLNTVNGPWILSR